MEQREIKFRALVVADGVKQMLLFNLPKMDNGLWAWPMDNNVHHIDDYLSPLMQFTGLKDKNGVEIYEGDIVNCSSGCPHVIEWRQEIGGKYIGGMPGWYLSGLLTGGGEGYAWAGSEEVIGNIHENPSLLTK